MRGVCALLSAPPVRYATNFVISSSVCLVDSAVVQFTASRHLVDAS